MSERLKKALLALIEEIQGMTDGEKKKKLQEECIEVMDSLIEDRKLNGYQE